jgi:tRNA threonylcarbamoyladenosine modification (KEOPS) complex  Pcc1 subunit
MKIRLEIEVDEKIFKAIAPDIGKNDRISYENGKMIYEVESKNFTHVKAALNSLLEIIGNLLKIDNIISNYGSDNKENNRFL